LIHHDKFLLKKIVKKFGEKKKLPTFAAALIKFLWSICK